MSGNLRLFVAVWPPSSLITKLRRLERPSRPGLRWTTEDQWHVTLRFYGSVESSSLPALAESLTQVAAQSGAVTVSAGPRPCPLSHHVWVLPVHGLADLADRFGPMDRRFRGHITLARAKQGDGLSKLAALDLPAPDLPAPDLPTPDLPTPDLPTPDLTETWVVDEFSLVKSELGADRARYQVLDRWRLESR